jgi:glycosyltransferase involved in cell wall biosynthesis
VYCDALRRLQCFSSIPEQIVEGRTGFLVPVGDARAMAERVLELLEDEELRLRMGREAAEDAARRFGLERMASEYLAFYRDILNGDEAIKAPP